MDKCVPVDWKILVTDDVQSQHIRCHPLQDGDELSMLVSNFKEQHAKAVILVNTQDNYSIDRQFLEGECVQGRSQDFGERGAITCTDERARRIAHSLETKSFSLLY